jgi:sugar phosphate isomerase/epimerase
MHASPAPLAVTVSALGPAPDCFALAAELRVAGAQLDAAQPGLRPRELDAGARRDVAATLRRLGLAAAGIDCFVPREWFAQSHAVERAMTVVFESIAMAEGLGRAAVSLFMPQDAPLAGAVLREAQRRGVPLADFARPAAPEPCGVGVDPVVILRAGGDPVREVADAGARLAAARVNDLDTAGVAGPIGGGRLDAMAFRVALDVSAFRGLPVVDCRAWNDPLDGCARCIRRWCELLPAVRP